MSASLMMPEPGKERKLVGYSVGNHINAKIKHIDRLGDVLDRMIAAGATEVWSLEFILSDPSKALDQAREAAIADARRKAGVYARAAGVALGRVVSIEEESGSFAPVPKRVLAQPAGAQIPIAPGENTLRASVALLTDNSQIGANLQVCADEENRADFDQRR